MVSLIIAIIDIRVIVIIANMDLEPSFAVDVVVDNPDIPMDEGHCSNQAVDKTFLVKDT